MKKVMQYSTILDEVKHSPNNTGNDDSTDNSKDDSTDNSTDDSTHDSKTNTTYVFDWVHLVSWWDVYLVGVPGKFHEYIKEKVRGKSGKGVFANVIWLNNTQLTKKTNHNEYKYG
eukprot:193942_1